MSLTLIPVWKKTPKENAPKPKRATTLRKKDMESERIIESGESKNERSGLRTKYNKPPNATDETNKGMAPRVCRENAIKKSDPKRDMTMKISGTKFKRIT